MKFKITLLLSLCLLCLLHASAQNDRPCGAPFLPLSGCSFPYKISFVGASYQAADAPLPPGCVGAYTHDVWVRVVAPGPMITLSFTTAAAIGSTPNPQQVEAAFYEETPTCSSLTPIGTCPGLCPLGVICLHNFTAEYHGLAREYTGFTAGQPYLLRILWNPAPDAAPDSILLSDSETRCSPCPPCGMSNFVLHENSLQLLAEVKADDIALHLEDLHPDEAGSYEVLRSGDGDDWQRLAGGLQLGEGSAMRYTDQRPDVSGFLMYQVRKTSPEGTQTHSNISTVHLDAQDWLQSWELHDGTLQLSLANPETGTLRLYDALGRELTSRAVTAASSRIEISDAHLDVGVYFLVMDSEPKSVAIRVIETLY